jgi:hypothetical protein
VRGIRRLTREDAHLRGRFPVAPRGRCSPQHEGLPFGATGSDVELTAPAPVTAQAATVTCCSLRLKRSNVRSHDRLDASSWKAGAPGIMKPWSAPS